VNRPVTEQFLKDCLFRCGGTPYLPRNLTCEMDGGLMLSMASIKAMRKEGLDRLTSLRLETYRRECKPYTPSFEKRVPVKEQELHISGKTFCQIEEIKGAQRYYLPAEEILKYPQKAAALGDSLFAVLPALCFSDTRWKRLLEQLQEMNIKGVQVNNIGMIASAKEMGFTVCGGTGLNITNSLALEEYQALGLADTLLSFELTGQLSRSIQGDLKRGMVGYGHLPLMRMRACPLKKGKTCGDCKGKGFLKDRKGLVFPVACHNKEFTTLYNPIPLYLGDKQNPTDYWMLQFTHESPEECKAITHTFLQGEKWNGQRTCGLFERTLL
ncbi:MAG: DUF3656 domain-containing protein, partial [Clostridia bacterium]|nr:DUF3656 domain-containing protein [Clostridia bacterium]